MQTSVITSKHCLNRYGRIVFWTKDGTPYRHSPQKSWRICQFFYKNIYCISLFLMVKKWTLGLPEKIFLDCYRPTFEHSSAKPH